MKDERTLADRLDELATGTAQMPVGCHDWVVRADLALEDAAQALRSQPSAETSLQKMQRTPAVEEALDQLRRAAVDLDEAHDLIAAWGAYADEYYQQKHDLTTDLARIKLAAGEARRKHEAARQIAELYKGEGGMSSALQPSRASVPTELPVPVL